MEFDFHLHSTFMIVVLAIIVSVTEYSSAVFTQDGNAVGHYRLDNTLQCQRLCWLKRQCAAFSFNRFVLYITDRGFNQRYWAHGVASV